MGMLDMYFMMQGIKDAKQELNKAQAEAREKAKAERK